MKKLVIGSLLVGVFGIGCAVGTIAHNSMVPVTVAQTNPSATGPCSCTDSKMVSLGTGGALFVSQCVCNGLNCLVSNTGTSCVPN